MTYYQIDRQVRWTNIRTDLLHVGVDLELSRAEMTRVVLGGVEVASGNFAHKSFDTLIFFQLKISLY